MRSRNLMWAVSSLIMVLSILLAACEAGDLETGDTEVQEPPPQEVEFPEEGVTVILPWQGEEMSIEKLTFNPPGPTLSDQCGLIRSFINFEVIDAEGEPVNSFQPPMTLVVRFSEDDAAQAGGRENLILGFFDEESEYWKVIEGGSTVIEGETMTGTVEVFDWGDRHTCWCRR